MCPLNITTWTWAKLGKNARYLHKKTKLDPKKYNITNYQNKQNSGNWNKACMGLLSFGSVEFKFP